MMKYDLAKAVQSIRTLKAMGFQIDGMTISHELGAEVESAGIEVSVINSVQGGPLDMMWPKHVSTLCGVPLNFNS